MFVDFFIFVFFCPVPAASPAVVVGIRGKIQKFGFVGMCITGCFMELRVMQLMYGIKTPFFRRHSFLPVVMQMMGMNFQTRSSKGCITKGLSNGDLFWCLKMKYLCF